ncbi:hypothetical protein AB0K94_14700 [Streptomyces sp. NPDC053794]|uniref:hypothetical protein n=1 Tax=Streptomyces sp. NPDC053794 TaxID=3154760 RepID=UPI00343AE6FE
MAACVVAVAALAAPVARADDSGQYLGGMKCAPGRCDPHVTKRTKPQGGGQGRRPASGWSGRGQSGGGSGAAGHRAEAAPDWARPNAGHFGLTAPIDALPGEGKGKDEQPGGGDGVPIEVVVEEAVGHLKLPKPVIRTSPDEDFVQVVTVPTWMWVDQASWDPVTASAELDGVKVTATARPRRAVWSMGEGGSRVCKGPGTPYSKKYDPRASSPDCGYTYQKTSLVDPGGTFTLAVQVTWDVEWHGGGQGGVVPGMVMAAQRAVTVDEVQAVVVR